jgi:uncharacterized LabA/DUF88 family protein
MQDQGLLTFGLQPLFFIGEVKMHKVMVFIDYENFEIARVGLYRKEHKTTGHGQAPWLDLIKLPKELVACISADYTLIKTFLFAPEPDAFLMAADWRKKKYDFLKGLGNTDFFTMIPGRHVARPIAGNTKGTMRIDDKATYFIDEKGTDINLAVQILTKAYHNAFDTAVIVSEDTDYIPIYDILNTIGKTVVVVGVKGQNLSRFKSHSDKQMVLGLDFLQNCEKCGGSE